MSFSVHEASATLDPVSYLAWDDTEKKLVGQTGDSACKVYEAVTKDTTEFKDGQWYVVNETVTNDNRITVSGTANLILADGVTLTSKGITVTGDQTLNIYAQSAGSTAGGLSIADVAENYAGIGGGDEQDGGTVNIHGGSITVTGGRFGAGIGGGDNDDTSYTNSGAVNIYGGSITSTGGPGSAGIGGGYEGTGGTVNIYGGTVNANGGTSGAGIGGGISRDGGTVTINGGTVTANGGSDAYGIGKGKDGSEDGTLTVATNHAAYSHTEEITDTTKASAEAVQGTGATITIARKQYMLVEAGTAPVRYPLWVGGVRVTENNKGDVLGDADDGATVTFTPATEGSNPTPATLTLNGFSYSGAGMYLDENQNTAAVIWNSDEEMPLTLKLSGTNTVEKTGSANYNDYAICSMGSLTIDGTGSLDVSANGNKPVAIYTKHDLTAVSGTVTAQGAHRAFDVVGNFAVNGENVTIDATATGNASVAIEANTSATFQAGSVTAQGKTGGIMSRGTLTVNGGTIAATGEAVGIGGFGDLIFNGGEITAVGTADDGAGVLTLSGGTVTVGANVTSFVITGGESAFGSDVTVKNALAGTGWTDTAGTTGRQIIDISTTGQSLTYKKVQFPADHLHSFTYAADGATITATCDNADSQCDLPVVGDAHVAALTIVKPTLETYGQTGDGISAAATLNADELAAFNDATGKAVAAADIKYVGREGTTYAESATAPTDAGQYAAKLTLTGVTTSEGANKSVTASAEYEIAEAGTPTLTDDQKPTANELTYTGEAQALLTAPKSLPEGYAIQYSLDGETWSDTIPTGTDAGEYTVKVKYVGDADHTDFSGEDVKVTIAEQEGKIRTDVEVKPGAPETSVAGLTQSVAEEMLTPAEKEAMDAGATVLVYLDVTNIEGEVSDAEREMIVAAATEQDSEAQVGMILDLSLFKKVGDETTQVTEVSQPISATITIPEELRKPGRRFFVVRIHEGRTDIVGEGSGDSVTLTSALFSTYAIIYVDENELEPEPATHYIILTQKGTNTPEMVTMGEKVIVVPKYADDQGWTVNKMTSSSRKVASIDPATGEMTLNKAGKTTIGVKAKNGRKSVNARVKLTVVDPTIPTKISIDQAPEIAVSVGKEDNCQLTVTAEPTATASSEVTWKSSKKSVVAVDENGKLTPRKTGKATITAVSKKDKKRKAKITVKVVDLTVPTGITLSTEGGSTTLTEGESIQLKYELTGPDADVPASSAVTWKSKNTRIARVSRDGLATAKKPGTVEIVAKTRRGKVTGSITLTVQPAASNSESDAAIEAQEDANAAAENVEAVVEDIAAELPEN